MTKYATQKAAALAQRLADQQAENERQLAAILDEQEAHEKKLAGAMKSAGMARVAVVEDLLETFGIGPAEHQPRRNKRTGEVLTNKDGTVKMFNPDPDETQRMAQLAGAIEALLETSAAPAAEARTGGFAERRDAAPRVTGNMVHEAMGATA